MSRVLLTIGYTTVLLPSDRGLATILAALRDAVRVESDRSYLTESPTVVIGDEVQVEFKTLPKRCRFTTKTDEGEEVACEEPTKAARKTARSRPALPDRSNQLLLGGPR